MLIPVNFIFSSGVRIFESPSNNIITRHVEELNRNGQCRCGKLPENAQFFTLVAGIRRVKDPMYLLDVFSGTR